MERFFGVLIEHFGGAFPPWLAPVQVVAIPVTPGIRRLRRRGGEGARGRGVRAELDKGDDRMNAKIRNAQNQKVPFMIILGEKEQAGGSVSLRTRSGEQKNLIPHGGFPDDDRGRGEAEDPGLTHDRHDHQAGRAGGPVPAGENHLGRLQRGGGLRGQGQGGGGAGDRGCAADAGGAAQTGGSWPTVEEIQDLVEKALIERGHARTAKAYIVYRYEHALKREGKESLTYSEENIPYRKLWEALSWATDHGCVYPAPSSRSRSGREASWSSSRRRTILRKTSWMPRRRRCSPDGTSSSRHHRRPLLIGKDHDHDQGKGEACRGGDHHGAARRGQLLLRPRRSHPKIGEDDYDFETPQALDLALINQHLRRWSAESVVGAAV